MFCVVKSYSDGRISPQFLNWAPRRRLSNFKPLINAARLSMRSGETKAMCRRPATAVSTGPHYPGFQPFDVASRPWRSMQVTSFRAKSGVSRNDPETLGDDHASSGDEPGHWRRIGFPFQQQLRTVHTSFQAHQRSVFQNSKLPILSIDLGPCCNVPTRLDASGAKKIFRRD